MADRFLLMILCLQAAAWVHASQNPDAMAGPVTTNASPDSLTPAVVRSPRIKLASPVFDFGRVPAGTVVPVAFSYTNVGTGLLEIKEIRPGCGCTSLGAWEKSLEPGRGASVQMQMNTAGLNGTIIKSATIICNDPAQPSVILMVKGEVWRPVDVQPGVVVINLASDQETSAPRIVRVINNTEQDLSLEEPVCSNASFKPALKVVRPGKEYEIAIVTVPPLKTGTTQGAITARTSFTNVPVISFPVLATVQSPVVAVPAEVVLPAVPFNDASRFSIMVRNNDSAAPITLGDPSLSISNVTATVTPVQPGWFFNVTLAFPAGFQLKPGESGLCILKTSNPKVPVIRVPIRSAVGGQAVSPAVAVPQK